MSLKTPDYIPGSCNIGGQEIRRRQYVTVISAIFTLVAFIFLISTDMSRTERLLIFFPIVATGIGWQQTRRRFCLAYGLSGVFNFGTTSDRSMIEDPVARAADRALVLKVLVQSAAVAGVLTLLVAILPL